MVKWMEEEFLSGLTERLTKVTLREIKCMEKDQCFILMDKLPMENGNLDKMLLSIPSRKKNDSLLEYDKNTKFGITFG